MNVIVFGPTGGTGRAVVRDLLAAGHTVTAYARDPAKLGSATGLTVVQGDATDGAAVGRAVAGHDAVVVSLGDSQSPFARLFGARPTTPRDVCEAGTSAVIAAMQAAQVGRLVCVTAYGVGDTRDKLTFAARLLYRVLLREQIADKERQEALVKASALEWTLIQPVGLSDKPATGRPITTTDGAIGQQRVSRADVAAVVVQALTQGLYIGRTVAVSG